MLRRLESISTIPPITKKSDHRTQPRFPLRQVRASSTRLQHRDQDPIIAVGKILKIGTIGPDGIKIHRSYIKVSDFIVLRTNRGNIPQKNETVVCSGMKSRDDSDGASSLFCELSGNHP